METKTTKELAAKAIEKITPITEKEKSATKAAIENVAILTTLITISAYVVMYAYKGGYCEAFKIPAVCVRVTLKDYLPLLFHLSGLSFYILWYASYLKSDKALSRIKINWYRIVYGYMLIYMTLYSSSIIRFFPKYTPFFICIGISFVIELFVIFVWKSKENKENRTVSQAEQNRVLNEMISSFFFYRYYIRTGLYVLMIIVFIAPLWGRLVAIANERFQVFQVDNVPYAVIADFEDSIIAQRVRVDDTSIEINTSNYTFFQKEGIEFEYQSFEHVTRTTEFSEETAVDEEMTFIPASNN